MVNRMWRWIFGQGIVSTVDELRSHGKEAQSSGVCSIIWQLTLSNRDWSIKELVRYLVTTQAFQAESVSSEAGTGWILPIGSLSHACSASTR